MVSGKLVVGVTGASGSIYAVRFLKAAAEHFEQIFVIVTDEALQVFGQETGNGINRQSLNCESFLSADYPQISFLNPKSYFTPPASGSARHDGMVIIPCSMGTVGRIASGLSDDLMCRAADVCLKERRKLILVVREAPYSIIHLQNMTRLTEAGATILPASPSFYHKPETVEDLVDTVVARALQLIGIEQKIQPEWQVKARHTGNN